MWKASVLIVMAAVIGGVMGSNQYFDKFLYGSSEGFYHVAKHYKHRPFEAQGYVLHGVKTCLKKEVDEDLPDYVYGFMTYSLMIPVKYMADHDVKSYNDPKVAEYQLAPAIQDALLEYSLSFAERVQYEAPYVQSNILAALEGFGKAQGRCIANNALQKMKQDGAVQSQD